MIEIKPEDIGKRIWDIWLRGWAEILSVTPNGARISSVDNSWFLPLDGTHRGAPRFSWEETPLPELRKRPKEPVKFAFKSCSIDVLYKGVEGRLCFIPHYDTETSGITNYIGKKCKVTCEVEE